MSPDTQSDWAVYTPNRYIERREVDKKLKQWGNSITEQSMLLSLTGAPGTGKSWLLQDLAKRPADRLPVSPFGVILYQAEKLLAAFQVNHLELKRELIQTANSCCAGLNLPMDLVPTLGAIVVSIAQQSQTACVKSNLFVFIDGWDELVNDGDFARLQEIVRSTFLSSHSGFFRIIMARRRPLTNHYLKLMDHHLQLDVFDEAEAREQQNQQAMDPLELLFDGAKYQWNHPFINAYLLNQATASQPLNFKTLQACCLELVNRPSTDNQTATRFPPLTVEDISSYSRLATRLGEHWTKEDFKSHSKRALQSVDLNRGIVVVRQNP